MTDEAYRRHQEDRCRSKERFRTAQKAANARDYQFSRHGVLMAIYRCSVCHWFHLTSRSQADYDYREFEKAMMQAHREGLLTREEVAAGLKGFGKKG